MIDVALIKLCLIPVTGASLGWVTNWVAIKMLFYPKEPLNILGIRFNSVHGLFPRHRLEFAEKTGVLFNQILQPSQLVKDLKKTPMYQQLFDAFNEEMDKRLLTIFVGATKRKEIYDEFWNKLTFILSTNNDITGSLHEYVRNYILNLDGEELFELFDSYIGTHISALTWIGALIGFFVGCVQVGILVLL